MPISLDDYPPLSPLPLSLTSFIGRERELALAHSLLQRPNARLLTLTGAGGIGKSRLALQIAADLDRDAPGSVRVVPLAAVPQAGAVAATLADALGITAFGKNSSEESLAGALRDTEHVIVLDNFEHLLDAAPLLTDLLAACPGLKFLVTSRAILRVAGEHVLPVPPLVVPPAGAKQALALIAASPAAQLFVERAQAASGSFALTETNAPLVAEICRRLDGVPLAIELAAARVNHLPLGLLRDRMDQRLALLTGGPRDRPLRLQTMRAAIAWSYDLLSATEQTLLNRLAVFVGGWTLAAAEAVCGPLVGPDASLDHPQPVVFDLLASLVDKSLVQHVVRADGTARYALLETIREFAAERLLASGEADAIRRAHATFFRQFAESSPLGPFLPDDRDWLDQLDAERGNLRAALDWLDATGANGEIIRLAAALSWFWFVRGHLSDALIWLDRALAVGDVALPAARAKLWLVLGMVLLSQARIDFDHIRQVVTEGLAQARAAGDPLAIAQVLVGLGGAANMAEDYDRATIHLNEALAITRTLGDSRLAASVASAALGNLGVTAHGQGRLSEALAYRLKALAEQRAAGYQRGELLTLADLGDDARDQGDLAGATARYQESLVLAREYSEQRGIVEAIEGIAVATIMSSDPQRGVRLLAAAERRRELVGMSRPLGYNLPARQQAVTAARAALGEATFAAVWATGRAVSMEQAVAEVLAGAGSPAVPSSTVLTPREEEILRFLVAGQTDRAIAETLFISTRTVENHVARIFAKLGVRTRTAAATTAIAIGLFEPDASTPAES